MCSVSVMQEGVEQSVYNLVISNGDCLLVSCLIDILEGGIFHPMVFLEYNMQILTIYLYIFRCI